MGERIVNSVIFAVEDNVVTTLIVNKLKEYGELSISLADKIYYFTNNKSRVDLFAKRDEIVISLNLDFGFLVEKVKYREATLICPTSNDDYLAYFNKINLVGFQRHMLPNHVLTGVNINRNDNMSLGMIANNLGMVEPVFRKSNLINFDLSSVKYGDLPISKKGFSTGLTTEQFTQLVKYAGYSDSLQVINFQFEEYDNPELLADLLATSIWYFLESIENAKDFDSDKESIVLNLAETDHYVVLEHFFSSGKCYFSLEDTTQKHPCSKEDFHMAKDTGVLSERILQILRNN